MLLLVVSLATDYTSYGRAVKAIFILYKASLIIITFNNSQMFASRAGAYPSGAPLYVRHLALHANFRLAGMTNTLAHLAHS